MPALRAPDRRSLALVVRRLAVARCKPEQNVTGAEMRMREQLIKYGSPPALLQLAKGDSQLDQPALRPS